MRPDRVMRTSVLSPMVGYNPGRDVQAVADEFTTGPASGMTLGGFGRGVYYPHLRGFGAAGGGLFPRLRNWWAGVRARAWMRKQGMPAQRGVSDASVPGGGVAVQQSAYGPAAGMGPWGVPQTRVHQMVANAYGQSSNFPPNMQEGIDKTTMMMWRGLRWPWH